MNGASIAAAAVVAGAGVATWAALAPSSHLFGPTVRHTGNARTLALTFDDGPNPAVTPRLLHLLERHGARATFFLIGDHVRACPALARDMAARGHVLANHTDTHPNLIWLSSRQIRDELDRCQESIGRITGQQPGWMRPPYGARGPHLNAVVQRGGWAGVAMWSLWLYDWKPQPAARVIRRLRRARGGDIVLLHDGDPHALEGDRMHSAQALEYWLPRWKDAGLEFVTLDALGGGGARASR
jgi:peptidoglycan/xylan/chitin deacetylase (PgdA/CDA1 family)